MAQAPITVKDLSDSLALGQPWQIALFDFVDGFRRDSNKKELIATRPSPRLPNNIQSLIASTVAALSHEAQMYPPEWCMERSYFLKDPWFVSGAPSLYAMALVESPIFYRMNNIFVLENFLNRC